MTQYWGCLQEGESGIWHFVVQCQQLATGPASPAPGWLCRKGQKGEGVAGDCHLYRAQTSWSLPSSPRKGITCGPRPQNWLQRLDEARVPPQRGRRGTRSARPRRTGAEVRVKRCPRRLRAGVAECTCCEQEPRQPHGGRSPGSEWV